MTHRYRALIGVLFVTATCGGCAGAPRTPNAAAAAAAAASPTGDAQAAAAAAAAGPAASADAENTEHQFPPDDWRAGAETELCSHTVTEHDVHRCVTTLTPEQARRRSFHYVLYTRDGAFVGYEEMTPRGIPGANQRTSTSWEYLLEASPPTIIGRDQNGIVRQRTVMSADRSYYPWSDGFGHPKVSEGSRAAGMVREFDARGRVTSYRYVDAAKNPVPNDEGTSRVDAVRDDAGSLTSQSFFDGEGAAILNSEGVHRIVDTVDDHGWVVRRSYLGVKGESVLHKNGYHAIEYRFDDVGNETRRMFLGLDGKPVVAKHEAVAGWERKRDAFGSEVSLTFLTVDGRPMLNPTYRYASRKQVLDARGRTAEYQHFDVGGRPINRKEGNFNLTRTYDGRGNKLEDREFAKSGDPKPGIYRRRWSYDERDNEVLVEFFGHDDELFSGNFAVVASSYDRFDRLVERNYRNASGEFAARGSLAYSVEVITRADDGSIVETTYFAPDGSPVTLVRYEKLIVGYGYNRTQDEARELLGQILDAVEKGETLSAAANAELTPRIDIDEPKTVAVRNLPDDARDVVPTLGTSEVSRPVDIGSAFVVYRRLPAPTP